jgi:uncharacterized protein (TIGR00730 family)
VSEQIRSVCVFCGSNTGSRPEFTAVATELGTALAAAGLDLVYGGGHVGLMGAVADAALAGGGRVTGVMPATLVAKEIAHRGLTDLRVTATMHERKALMADLADGFIALPGGFGTFDELFEVVTWAQLGFHAKPVVLLDAAGFFDPLLAMVDRAIADGFVPAEHRALLMAADDVDGALALLEAVRPPVPPKWLDRSAR